MFYLIYSFSLGVSTLFLSVKCYLLWCAQDLANLEYGVHFTGAREERSEGIKLCHDAANSPLVYGWTVGCGSEEHLWGSIPSERWDCKHLRLASLWERTSSERNSPSRGDIVCVWRSRSDFPGEPKVSYFHQLGTHAQKILRFHVPVEKPWQQKLWMTTLRSVCKPSNFTSCSCNRPTMLMNERQPLEYLKHNISYSRFREQTSPVWKIEKKMQVIIFIK